MRSQNLAMFPALLFLLMLALSGCGEIRPVGQRGGIPVSFTIDFDYGYVGSIARDDREFSFGAGNFSSVNASPYSGSRYRYFGNPGLRPSPFYEDPWWCESAPSGIYLLGGAAPLEAGIFHMELQHRHVVVDIPILPKQVVTLTVQVRGHSEGWEVIGHFTSADQPGQRVGISLSETGPKVTVTPPPDVPEAALSAAPPPPAEPSAAPSTDFSATGQN